MSSKLRKSRTSVRDGQDDILDRIDTYEAALLGLTEAVAENTRMLEAIIEHLKVPYKPQAGFLKE